MEACSSNGKPLPKTTQRGMRMTKAAKRTSLSLQTSKSSEGTKNLAQKTDDKASLALPATAAEKKTIKVKGPKVLALHSLNPDHYHGKKKKSILAAKRHHKDREQRKEKMDSLEAQIRELKETIVRRDDVIYLLKNRIMVDVTDEIIV